jgi:ATP-dependent exoDNAse (exonuclease V) alpha subunit
MCILKYLQFATPTQEQLIALNSLEKFVEPNSSIDVFILSGAAGTGKSSVVSALVGHLNAEKIQYRIAAPTGKAARIIGRKSNATAQTIHSLIYNVNHDINTGAIKYSLKCNISPNPCIFIIDEASMIPAKPHTSGSLYNVDKGLLHDLFTYVKRLHENSKIIFLGDNYQLSPVFENDSLALDLEFLKSTFGITGQIAYLKEVMRQQNGSSILEDAIRIRDGIDRGEREVRIRGRYCRDIKDAANRYVDSMLTYGYEKQIAIGVSHKSNAYFNKLVRSSFFKNPDKVLLPGDLLVINKNWNKGNVQLYNGDQVKLISADWSSVEEVAGLRFVPVKFQPIFSNIKDVIEDFALLECITSHGGEISQDLEIGLRRDRFIKNPIYRNSANPSDDRYVGALRFSYSYSITCNKAQGGEWDKVFINTMGIPSLRWKYTALTRAVSTVELF